LAAQLDEFYNAHLPNTVIAGPLLRDWPELDATVAKINQWLKDASIPRPLRDWGKIFRGILEAIYGSRTLDLEKGQDDALHRILGDFVHVLEQLDLLPSALDFMPLSGVDTFHLVLGALADKSLPPPANPNALEILGWLELPLDDSRAIVVTSFNEGFVPKSTSADAFLPDRFRRELGLEHNERRYARDAYATTVLCASGKELRVLFARRDTQKDPLQPSRLIFACPDETMVERARTYFTEHALPPSPRRLLLAVSEEIPKESSFKVPPPATCTFRREIAVTEFKHFLACPYRYYLRYVCNLRAIDDSAPELDGSAFGTLLHETLSAFGHGASSPRNSNRADDIFGFLVERLDALAKRKYGESQRRPAIYLQLEQARRRLRAFASRQAELCNQGWRIIYVEQDGRGPLSATWIVDDQPIKLMGRIDRIDYHEETNCIRILDYKTASTAQSPQATHRKNEAWIDLQLPLYRRLWPSTQVFNAGASIELGYFNLPKNQEETKVVLADWDDSDLEEANQEADRVIRGIIKSDFGMPTYPPPLYSEDFAAICLDNRHRKPEILDDAAGGAA
jgi:hypothetical protein